MSGSEAPPLRDSATTSTVGGLASSAPPLLSATPSDDTARPWQLDVTVAASLLRLSVIDDHPVASSAAAASAANQPLLDLFVVDSSLDVRRQGPGWWSLWLSSAVRCQYFNDERQAWEPVLELWKATLKVQQNQPRGMPLHVAVVSNEKVQ